MGYKVPKRFPNVPLGRLAPAPLQIGWFALRQVLPYLLPAAPAAPGGWSIPGFSGDSSTCPNQGTGSLGQLQSYANQVCSGLMTQSAFDQANSGCANGTGFDPMGCPIAPSINTVYFNNAQPGVGAFISIRAFEVWTREVSGDTQPVFGPARNKRPALALGQQMIAPKSAPDPMMDAAGYAVPGEAPGLDLAPYEVPMIQVAPATRPLMVRHRLVPPSTGEREAKTNVNIPQFIRDIAWAWGQFTEATDFVDAFFYALPKHCQDRARVNGVHNLATRSLAVWNCIGEIDMNRAFFNLLQNEVIDRMGGEVGERWKEASRTFGFENFTPQLGDAWRRDLASDSAKGVLRR